MEKYNGRSDSEDGNQMNESFSVLWGFGSVYMPILYSLLASGYFIHSYWNERKNLLTVLNNSEHRMVNHKELIRLELGEDAYQYTTSTNAITGRKIYKRRLKYPRRVRRRLRQVIESEKGFRKFLNKYGMIILLLCGSLATFSVSLLSMIFGADGLHQYISFGTIFFALLFTLSLIPVKLNGTFFSRSLLFCYAKEVLVSTILFAIILISVVILVN